MSTKINAMLPLLQSSNSATVHKCLTDLYKLPSISARELKESGIYDLVHRLTLKNHSHVRHAAQKLYKRWHILVAAYEQSEMVDKHPESMKPGSSSNSQRSSMPVSNKNLVDNHSSSPGGSSSSQVSSMPVPHKSNHKLSPRPPATPDDVLQPFTPTYYQWNSGHSSKSDEPTFHHGLEPEGKSKNSKQNPRLHDPLQLESVISHDSMEDLRADSGSYSGNSQRSGSTDPTDSLHHERSSSNQPHQWGNGAPCWENERDPIRANGVIQPRVAEGFSGYSENLGRREDVPVARMNGVAESSPEDPNLCIPAGSSEPTQISGGAKERDAVIKNIEMNFTTHKFRAVKRDSGDGIPQFKRFAYLYSRMGLVTFKHEMAKYFKFHCKCKNTVSEEYLHKAFYFYVNLTMDDHAQMPPAPSPDHVFDFDKDYRRGRAHQHHRRPSEYHNRSSIPNKTVTEDNRNSLNHSASTIQVPNTPKSSDNYRREPNTFPGLADAASSSKRQSTSSVAKKESVSSHKEHRQHEKYVNETSKRKSDRSFPMKQPEQNSVEPPRKVLKPVSSHSSVPAESTAECSSGEPHRKLPTAPSSNSGLQGNQTVNFSGDSSRKAPKTANSSTCSSGHKSSSEGSTNRVVRILQSVPGLEDPSLNNAHSSSAKPLTLMGIVSNPNIPLISPIASPERVPAAAPQAKEKRPKHRSKEPPSPTLELNASRMSPIVDVVSRTSTSMSSPTLEGPRPGASKGSPSMDFKVPNSRTSGPSTSKGASKEASREKKPRQTKKKPEKGKLWTRSMKDFDVLRKRN